MRITYEIKSFDEFNKLPLICKIGVMIFYLGVISFFTFFILDFLNINLIKHVSSDFPIYSLLIGLLGFLITIIFDKGRTKRTKIGSLDGDV
jgi:amino acid transporter